VRGAVLYGVNEQIEVRDDLEADRPQPGEVRLRMRATGVCHSDLSGLDGTAPVGFPCVMGHEGAGEVVELGDGVTDISVGDHAIIAWSPPCGTCRFCLGGQPHLCLTVLFRTRPRFRYGARHIEGFAGVGSFAEEVTLPREAVVTIPEDVPFHAASLIGCAVMTGVGAAINTAKVTPGASVLVLGCGGVGTSVIQGARIAGAAEIVAVDRVDAKLDLARGFGATDAVTPDQLPEIMGSITGGDGFDFAFEAIGSATTMRSAFDMTRRGGCTCIVGAGRPDQVVELSAFELFFAEKRLTGSYYGSGDVRSDFHRLIRLWRTGRLDLDAMVTQRIPIDNVNDAFAAMKRGEGIRTLIEFD
jgi:S-(hydroxymethyl)glutathione dehydrogenase/alcohol dehydrogenase